MLLNNQQETTKLYSTTTPVAISKAADRGNSSSSKVTTGAGVGSPETKRKNTQMLDTNWIVGFFEGECCIISTMTSYGSDLSFIVPQADPEILYKLQQHFGFGSVFKRNDGYWTFAVRAQTDLLVIINLLKGKLV